MTAQTPTWSAATTGSTPQAGHINQLLGTHATTLLYTGTQTAAQTTAAGTATNSNSLYIAQSFATTGGQTQVGYVQLYLDSAVASGGNLGTITVSLYANSAGAPTGSPIVTTTATTEYVNAISGASTTTFVTYPLPATVSPSTTYWIVTAPAGNGSFFYTWKRSTQVSGASTSSNGTSWTAQAYGMVFKVFDQTAANPLVATWEDAGARWTWRSTNTSGQIAQYAEYTAGQTAAGYLQSFRTLSYTNGLLTGVA
jgi:hypothetical protein